MGIRSARLNPGAGRAVLATLSLLALLLIALPAQAARITLLQKPVEVKPAGATAWKPLNLNDEVVEGDSIRTGTGGRCEVTITEKRVFRIGSASEVVLDKLVLQDGNMNSKVRVLLGRVWSAIIKPVDTGGGETYSIETPTATLGIKGTRFDVSFDGKTQALQTAVLQGQVIANPVKLPQGPPTEVSGPRQVAPPQQISRGEWVLLVSANQKLIFIPGQEPQVVPITDEDRADEWVKFNDARDQAIQ